MKKTRKAINYVDKAEFHALMVKHKARVKACEAKGFPVPIPCDGIGRNLLKIAKGLSSRYNFSRYSFREEMESAGIIDAVNAINKFDPDQYNNPFGYFTTVMWNAFVHYIEDEELQTYVKFKETESAFIFGTMVEGDSQDAFSGVIEENDYRDDFVSNFERKQALKKEKREIRKRERLDEISSANEHLFLYEETETDLDE